MKNIKCQVRIQSHFFAISLTLIGRIARLEFDTKSIKRNGKKKYSSNHIYPVFGNKRLGTDLSLAYDRRWIVLQSGDFFIYLQTNFIFVCK